MNGRLILSITSTIVEEAALAAVVLWLLPQWNIRIPLWALILALLVWTAYSIITHRAGSSALKMKQPVGLHNMISCQGEVVIRLAPEGVVRIKGELWKAISAGGDIKEGREVTVLSQDRLKLTVRECGRADTPERGA